MTRAGLHLAKFGQMASAPPPPARPPTSETMLFARIRRSGRNRMVRDRISLRRRLDEIKNRAEEPSIQ
jgi:hypothetical protein